MKNILIIWRTFCIMERLCKWERFFVEPSMPITTPKRILTVLEKVTFNSGITNNAWQHTKSLKTHCSALETHPITHVKTFNSDMVICCYHWIYHIFAALHKQQHRRNPSTSCEHKLVQSLKPISSQPNVKGNIDLTISFYYPCTRTLHLVSKNWIHTWLFHI